MPKRWLHRGGNPQPACEALRVVRLEPWPTNWASKDGLGGEGTATRDCGGRKKDGPEVLQPDMRFRRRSSDTKYCDTNSTQVKLLECQFFPGGLGKLNMVNTTV